MSADAMTREHAAVYRRRLFVNRFNLVMSLGTMAFGMAFLLWILVRAVRERLRGAVADAVHADDAAAGLRRRARQRDLRQRADRRRRDVHQHADRHPRRHLPRRIRQGRLDRAALTRFINDILLSAPSIVHRPVRLHGLRDAGRQHFSGWAGSFALALIAIPVVVRTTENMLQLVPNSLREAAIALGAPMWKVILMVTLKAVRGGVITGILLAVARISGETAPLLFTALNNQFWSADMNAPMANLPVVIFQFAMSPFDDWKTLAWAGALLITLTVLVLNILARTVFRQAAVR